jgi:hypothetical protein
VHFDTIDYMRMDGESLLGNVLNTIQLIVLPTQTNPYFAIMFDGGSTIYTTSIIFKIKPIK